MRRGGRLDKVAERAAVASRPLVGRAGEVDAVIDLVHDAAGGQGGALLISGEAGVGKTALAQAARARVAHDSEVLWAPCLPLTSLAVPFLPLATALREWATESAVLMPVLGARLGRGVREVAGSRSTDQRSHRSRRRRGAEAST
jgi:predicted ATPase